MSDCARHYWTTVYKHSDHITRIDLQLTYDIGFDPQPLIWKFYKQANRASSLRKRGPKNQVLLDNDGGATLYCGVRESNLFGRVYARGPKTKLEEDKHMLRFEVQYNKRLATIVARQLRSKMLNQTYLGGRVLQFFRARGLNTPAHFGFPESISLPRNRTELEHRLSWLGKACRPSCVIMAERGLLPELIRALGLDAFVDIRQRTPD